MTVKISKPALNLREELAALRTRIAPRRHCFPFTGDSSKTAFQLPRGWKPYAVYQDGSRKREGSGNDYTVGFDGFLYSVVFAVAPAAVFVEIDAEGVPA